MRVNRLHAAWFALAGLIVCSVVVRVRVNHAFQGPQILCDEYTYAWVARHFATTGDLGLGGGPTAGGSLLYPILIAPAWLAHTMSTAFGLTKTINAVLVSLTAVPVYLWARRVVSPWWGLVAAALVLLMTGLVLSGMLMSENAALPVFMLALYAIGTAVEDPTLWRQAFVLVLLPLAYEARAQGLVLLAILPTAVLLNLLFEVRGGVPRNVAVRGLRRFLPLAVFVAIALVGYLAHSGFSPAHAVGFYRRIATTHYDPLAVALWTARHAGEAALALGIAPFCALLLLLLTALTRGLGRREERAFVATATASVLWFLVQAGMYASAFKPAIIERYSMYAFPPLLIALAVWLGQDLVRPKLETAVAAVSSVALASLIIFSDFIGPEGPFPTGVFAKLSLLFFIRLPQHVPGGLSMTRIALVILAVVAVLVVAAAPGAFARVLLPVASALVLVLASRSAYGALSANTQGWANSTGPMKSWIDDKIGTSADSADYLYVPNPSQWTSSTVLVNTQFWNRSIGTLYTLGPSQLCPLPLETLRLDDRTGILANVRTDGLRHERYLVTDRGLAIAGKLIASGGSAAQPLAIYRPARPLRLASQVVGLYSDGWTGPDAVYRQYWSPSPRRGRIDVALSRVAWAGPDAPGKVTVTVRRLGGAASPRPLVTRGWTAHRGGSTVLRLRTPAPPFEVGVQVTPTFSPAQFGSGDTRQLGVQLTLSYVPLG